MRFAYGRDLIRWGGAYRKIGEQVGADNMVGEVMCEHEVAVLFGHRLTR
jgi:hypothetical protein